MFDILALSVLNIKVRAHHKMFVNKKLNVFCFAQVVPKLKKWLLLEIFVLKKIDNINLLLMGLYLNKFTKSLYL